VVLAELGDDVGVVSAAVVAFDRFRSVDAVAPAGATA
jgi:hypothetical protein